jgi:hypothetical protein
MLKKDTAMNRFHHHLHADELATSVAFYFRLLLKRSGRLWFVGHWRRLKQSRTHWFSEMACPPGPGCTARRLWCCWG